MGVAPLLKELLLASLAEPTPWLLFFTKVLESAAFISCNLSSEGLGDILIADDVS